MSLTEDFGEQVSEDEATAAMFVAGACNTHVLLLCHISEEKRVGNGQVKPRAVG